MNHNSPPVLDAILTAVIASVAMLCGIAAIAIHPGAGASVVAFVVYRATNRTPLPPRTTDDSKTRASNHC